MNERVVIKTSQRVLLRNVAISLIVKSGGGGILADETIKNARKLYAARHKLFYSMYPLFSRRMHRPLLIKNDIRN
jgi:hypothetical protein